MAFCPVNIVQGIDFSKSRVRPESFADHYSQARQFYCSPPLKSKSILSAYTFELSKVETLAVGEPVISLLNIDQTLAKTLAKQRFYQREP